MNISKELFEKAKQAKTAEELLEMAKAENIELSAEQAAKAFAELNKSGELSDEELDNVSGGCGDDIDKEVYRRDSRGNATHWREINNTARTYRIYHHNCPFCRRVLHEGINDLLYCDRCGHAWISIGDVVDEEGTF